MMKIDKFESIAQDLAFLQKHLTSLEKYYDKNFSRIEAKGLKYERLKLKENKLIESQNKTTQRLIINSGGTKFETTYSCILNCKYQNVLIEMISKVNINDIDMQQSTRELFLEMDGNIFEPILQIIRQSPKINDEWTIYDPEYEDKEKAFRKIARISEGEFKNNGDVFIENIKLFFYKEWERVISDFNINPIKVEIKNPDYNQFALQNVPATSKLLVTNYNYDNGINY
jgi:hypothetical protein